MPLISLNEDTVKRIELLDSEPHEPHDKIVNRLLNNFWRKKEKNPIWNKVIKRLKKKIKGVDIDAKHRTE